MHYITLHCIALHYITLHCITLHYLTLRYVTLRYVTLHYMHTYIHIYIYTYTYTHTHIYTYTYTRTHTHIYIYINIYICIYIHIFIYIYIHMYIYSRYSHLLQDDYGNRNSSIAVWDCRVSRYWAKLPQARHSHCSRPSQGHLLRIGASFNIFKYFQCFGLGWIKVKLFPILQRATYTAKEAARCAGQAPDLHY